MSGSDLGDKCFPFDIKDIALREQWDQSFRRYSNGNGELRINKTDYVT